MSSEAFFFFFLSFKHSFMSLLTSRSKIEQIKFSFCGGKKLQLISFLTPQRQNTMKSNWTFLIQSRKTPRRKTERKNTCRAMTQSPHFLNKADFSSSFCSKLGIPGQVSHVPRKCSSQKAGASPLGKCLFLLTMQWNLGYLEVHGNPFTETEYQYWCS